MKRVLSNYRRDYDNPYVLVDCRGIHTTEQWLQARKEWYRVEYNNTAKVRA